MAADLNKLIISVSGFTQEVYQKYHRGGKIDRVMANLKIAADHLKKGTDCLVEVHYLKFLYNEHEIDAFEEWCKSLGLAFVVKEGRGLDRSSQWYKVPDPFLAGAPRSAIKHTMNLKPCAQVFEIVSLDCKGDVYLCCCWPYIRPMRIGNFMEMDNAELFLKKFMHPECGTCPFPRRDWTDSDLEMLESSFRHNAKRLGEKSENEL